MSNDDQHETQPRRLASMLGWGYDVFGSIADPGFATQPLFRSGHTETIELAPGVEWTVPGFTQYVRHNERNQRTIFASSRSGWLRQKGGQYGLKGKYTFFSGQAQANFKDVWSTDHERDYFEILDEVALGYCKLPVARQELRAMLDPSFARALHDDAPEELFRTFGTHYVHQLRIGGVIRFLGSIERNEQLDRRSREAGVKAAFNKAVASTEFSANFNREEKAYGESVRRQASLSVVGGPVAEAHRVEDPNDRGGVAAWVAAVPQFPAVLDFGPSRGIVPLWQLVDDPLRRRALEDGFVRFARSRGQVFEPPTLVALSNEIEDGRGMRSRRVMRIGTEPPTNAVEVELLTTMDQVQEGGWEYGRSLWKMYVRVSERSGYGDGIEYVEIDGQRWLIVGGYQTIDERQDKYLGFGSIDAAGSKQVSIGRCRVRLRQLGIGGTPYGDGEVWLVLAPSSTWRGPRYTLVGGFDANEVPGELGRPDREHEWGDALHPFTIPAAKCRSWSETRRAWGDGTLTFCYREL